MKGWLFEIYDCDKNGYITFDELIKMIKLLVQMKHLNTDAYKLAFDAMDKADLNLDGRLSKKEFIAACTKHKSLENLFLHF
jgi:Ca2+-binding EF-hand superfamily protein